jgi:hypothetical protein
MNSKDGQRKIKLEQNKEEREREEDKGIKRKVGYMHGRKEAWQMSYVIPRSQSRDT